MEKMAEESLRMEKAIIWGLGNIYKKYGEIIENNYQIVGYTANCVWGGEKRGRNLFHQPK